MKDLNAVIRTMSFSIRGLLIGAGIGLLLIVLEDLYAWMSGQDSITGMLLGDFEQWKQDMVGGFNALKETVIGLWDAAINKFNEFKMKVLGFFQFMQTNPMAQAFIGGAGGALTGGPLGAITGAVKGYMNAPPAAPSSNTEVKIEVNGVNNPLDASKLVMSAIKQNTSIGNQSYGVLAR